MAILFDVRGLAVRRGLENPNQLRVFLSKQLPERQFDWPTASRLWNADSKRWLEKDTIELLCRAFACEPGDFIKYAPEKKAKKAK